MTGATRRLLLVAGVAAGLAAAGPAGSHTRSQSFSTWRVDGGRVEATVSVRAREVTRLPEAASGRALETVFARHLEGALRAVRGDEPCERAGPARALRAREGHVRVELRFTCPPEGALAVESEVLLAEAPSHVHFARVVGPGGAVEHLFTDARRRHVVLGEEGRPGGGAQGASFAGYLRLGVEHIVGGADHVAFLVSLLLLGGRPRALVFVVTGFTLGHSLTLSLAALGLVHVDRDVVEALIGFSIALVAAENLAVRAGDPTGLARLAGAVLLLLAGAALAGLGGPPFTVLLGLALFTFCYLQLARSADDARRLRPAVTTLFGLVHGFGFAAMLLEIGLPRGRRLAGLVGFNLGVELGQLVLVGLLIGGAAAGARVLPRTWRAAFRLPAAGVLSSALCALGVYWFVDRGWL